MTIPIDMPTEDRMAELISRALAGEAEPKVHSDAHFAISSKPRQNPTRPNPNRRSLSNPAQKGNDKAEHASKVRG